MSAMARTKARRSWFVPWCATWGALLSVLEVSCLNPRPEELPSHMGDSSEQPSDALGQQPSGTGGGASGPMVANPPPQPSAPSEESPGGEANLDVPDAGTDGGPDAPPLADPNP